MSNERQRAIAPRRVVTPDALPSQDRPQSSSRTIGVINSVDLVAGTIAWQRIRYKRTATARVPTRGSYQRFGPIEVGYPMETAVIEDYAVWAWGVGDITTNTIPIEAVSVGGFWLIEVKWKPDGSILVGTLLPAAGGNG